MMKGVLGKRVRGMLMAEVGGGVESQEGTWVELTRGVRDLYWEAGVVDGVLGKRVRVVLSWVELTVAKVDVEVGGRV